MTTITRLILLLATSVAVGVPAAAQNLERQMNLTHGPESVFDRPVGEVLPALVNARATGPNGRVGGELVFWGYALADGRQVNFFACALRADVDCTARVQAICPARSTTVLETRETTGKVVQRTCRTVGTAGAGETRPGCRDNVNDRGLLVGLAQCG